MSATFVRESPAYMSECEVTLEPGQRVRFLTTLPGDGVEIGDTATVTDVIRGDNTTVVLAPTKDRHHRLFIEDCELWKLEVVR
jgi:hypothetical protein